jgi:hypothetical protein
LGFGAEGRPERFVVVQSDELRALDSVVVAALDVDGAMYEGDPLVVHVSAREVGAKEPHVVLSHMLSTALLDRFEPANVGKLAASSMVELEELLGTVLDLA